MQISNHEWLTFSICEVQIADVPFASKAPKSIRNSQAMKRDANEMFFSVYSGLSKLSKSSFVFTSFYEKKFAPVYPFGLPVNAIIWTSTSRTDISMLSCPASSKSGVPSLFFFFLLINKLIRRLPAFACHSWRSTTQIWGFTFSQYASRWVLSLRWTIPCIFFFIPIFNRP